MDRSSLFKMSGLPEPFGVVLLVFSLILLLTPYFSGAGFGLFTIPIVNERAKKLLKIIGPLLFVSCILFFVPIFPNNKQAASTTSSSSPLSPTPSTELAKTDTNGSKIGNLPVNANNAEPIKTLPSSDEASNASSECTEKPYAIISNFDDDAYNGNPSSPTEFSIKEKPLKITNIYTRHRGWKGIPPPGAVIKLRNSAGKDLGSWRVTSGNEEWVCSPNIQLPVGTYRVIDPDPATWSQNVASEHKGMTRVEGCPTAGKPK